MSVSFRAARALVPPFLLLPREHMEDVCVAVGFSAVAINHVLEPAARSKQVRSELR